MGFIKNKNNRNNVEREVFNFQNVRNFFPHFEIGILKKEEFRAVGYFQMRLLNYKKLFIN